MAFPESVSSETSLVDYSNFHSDFSFVDHNSSNYDLSEAFSDSPQSTFYTSTHSTLSNGSSFQDFGSTYHSATSPLQQRKNGASPFHSSSSGNLQDSLVTSGPMGSSDDDVSHWLQSRPASTTNDDFEQPDIMNSFQLPPSRIVHSNGTDLTSWHGFEKECQVGDSPQQLQQRPLNNLGQWGGLQRSSPNVNSMSPARSVVMGSFSQPGSFHQTQGQSQQLQLSQEEMKNRLVTSHSENSVSTEGGGDMIQRDGRQTVNLSSSGVAPQISALSPIQHLGTNDFIKQEVIPASKNVPNPILDFDTIAAKVKKSSYPQPIPMKQQLSFDGVHGRSWDGSLTADSGMVSKPVTSHSRRGSAAANGLFHASQLRDSSSPSVLHQQQLQVPILPEELSDQQARGLLLVNLLVGCADAVAKKNQTQAMSLLTELSKMVSPHGDAIQRVASYFTYGLLAHISNTATGSALYRTVRIKDPTPADSLSALQVFSKVCPFMRFGEVTALQIILEAFQGEDDVHWIDLGMVPGSLWLSCQLLRALAARNGGPPKMIHFTGVQVSVSTTDDQSGRQLKEFADNLQLNFVFQPVPLDRLENLKPWMLTRRAGQVVAINCSAKMHTILYDDGNCVTHVLGLIHNLGPKVFCILEQEATHNVPAFLARFLEALHFYSAIFDTLEATLTRLSPERAKVEQLLLGQEIISIVSREGKDRIERHERFSFWRSRMAKAGFRQQPLSEAAAIQVKNLRCVSYGIGFTALEDRGSMTLIWQDRPLYTSSAWSM